MRCVIFWLCLCSFSLDFSSLILFPLHPSLYITVLFPLPSQSHAYKSFPPLLTDLLGYHQCLCYLVPTGLGTFPPTEAQLGSPLGKGNQWQRTESEVAPVLIVGDPHEDQEARLLHVCRGLGLTLACSLVEDSVSASPMDPGYFIL